MMERCTLKRPIGLGQGRGTSLLSVAQVPDDTTTDTGGEIHLLGATITMLLIGQEINGQRQTAPRQHGYQTLMAERTDEPIDGHRRDLINDGAAFQTEATMGRQQGIAGHCWPPLAIAENEVGEDREHGFAPRTLDTPDGDPPQADTHVMRVAGQAPAAPTAHLMLELKAQGEEKARTNSTNALRSSRSLTSVVSSWQSTVMVRLTRVWRAVFRMGHPQVR